MANTRPGRPTPAKKYPGSEFRLRSLSEVAVAMMMVIGALGIGCGGGESVSPSSIVVTDRTSDALTGSELQSANGTYGAGCSRRSGPWSLLIKDGAALAHPALSVVKGNTGCVLTMTSLTTAGQEYEAIPAFALTNSYQAAASTFSVPAGPTAFFGNGHLSAVTFTADFVVHILYSDDARQSSGNNSATFAGQTASASASDVPAPDYSIDVSSLVVETDDAKIVQTATGTADLTDATVNGQSYVVLTSLGATPSYSDIDDAFTAAGPPTAVSGAIPQIAASAFSLVGQNLTTAVLRYVIIADTTNGVPSYEVITITFDGP